MKRLAPAPGARKLNLAAVRRRRPLTGAEWESRDQYNRVIRTGHKVDILRDLAQETWRLTMETRYELRNRVNAVDWTVRLIVGVVASAAAVATMHLVWR